MRRIGGPQAIWLVRDKPIGARNSLVPVILYRVMGKSLTVAVGGRYLLDRAALAALASRLPGLELVTLDSIPPPRVLVWDPGPDDAGGLPSLPSGTAVLLLAAANRHTSLPAGVAGLFSKDEPPEALGIAIRQVARGEQYLSPALALALLRHQQEDGSRGRAADLAQALTRREREMLALLAEGLSNKAIAARLYLSVRTVEGHLANLYTRFGVHSRTEAALIAVQNGFTSQSR